MKPAIKNPCEVSNNPPNVLTVRFNDVRDGWRQWVLLSSDRHRDSIHCRRDLESVHFQKAVERDALIFDAGDLFDVMQGKQDRRQSKGEIRPEDVNTAYLDTVLNNTYNDLRPLAGRWALMGKGNHETKVLDVHGVDLINTLAYKMRNEAGGITEAGGYGGWVWFQFVIQMTVRQSVKMKYFHGSGQSPVMTFGTLDARRRMSFQPDADILLQGHTHDALYLPVARERLTPAGSVRHDQTHFIRTPGYKAEYGNGAGGFLVEKGVGPKPLGCAWVEFYYDAGQVKSRVELDTE